jgi:sporulation-control protein
MVFKRLLGSIGVGGPAVDTVLTSGAVLPGGSLTGEVHLKGGTADFAVEAVGLELVARVETETEDGEHDGVVVFERFRVGGGLRLAAGEELGVPFTIALPWETPISVLHGQPLGIVLGVRTEVEIAGARDKGDLDTLSVGPLPVQEAILEAFGQTGFGFRSADLEYGRIGGTGQQLPFYQEIELTPPPRYAHAVNEIELTFLATAGGMEVVLEADKRSGPYSDGHDALTRCTVALDGVAHTDWNAEVESWVRRLVEHRSAYGPHSSYGHDGHHDEGHGRRPGPGAGTAVAAGAAGLAVGVAGGLVAAEVVDAVGDFLEGEEAEGEEEDGEEGDEG